MGSGKGQAKRANKTATINPAAQNKQSFKYVNIGVEAEYPINSITKSMGYHNLVVDHEAWNNLCEKEIPFDTNVWDYYLSLSGDRIDYKLYEEFSNDKERAEYILTEMFRDIADHGFLIQFDYADEKAYMNNPVPADKATIKNGVKLDNYIDYKIVIETGEDYEYDGWGYGDSGTEHNYIYKLINTNNNDELVSTHEEMSRYGMIHRSSAPHEGSEITRQLENGRNTSKYGERSNHPVQIIDGLLRAATLAQGKPIK